VKAMPEMHLKYLKLYSSWYAACKPMLILKESSLVSKNLRDLLQFFVGISANSEIDPTYREMALSFMATAIRLYKPTSANLTHSKRRRIQSLKLGPDLLLSMLHIAMEPDDTDHDEDSPVKLAVVNIDILSTNLPPAHVLPPLLQQFPKLAMSNNPNERRAAMATLGAVMEGSLEFMADYIDDVLPHVFTALRDIEPSVVRAALVALSQITEELPSEVIQYHSTMVPVVFELLGSMNQDIMKAACNTLDAILEWVPQDAVAQYLPKLMEALLYIMTTHAESDVKLIVAGTPARNQLLTLAAIGTAAHASKEGFYPYLDSSMHTFFSMKEVVGIDHFDLRGCVTDTLGTIASAVGKDKFLPYMEKSFHLAFEGLKSGASRLRESAFCFFAVISEVLKDELTPILPQIMPAIVETLNQEDIDFGEKLTEDDAKALLDGGDGIDSDDDDDESIELNVNSALQLEKEIAADALGEIFVNVKGSFLPYLQTATEQLVELADTFYEGARKAALSALWKFVVTLAELQVTEAWQPGLPVVRTIIFTFEF
jgi:importin-4